MAEGKVDAADLLINVLRQHEQDLDLLIGRLEKTVTRLEGSTR